MIELGICAVLVAILVWAHLKNACPDCGEQLKWVGPRNKTMPLTRCFRCRGPHPAYVKPEYHHLYVFEADDDSA